MNQRAIRALMEILSVTDDPTFDDEVKAEEELAAKEGRGEDEDESDGEAGGGGGVDGKRKSRLNVGSLEESGSDSSCSDADADDDEDSFEEDEGEDGEEKKKRTPKKKKKKKTRKKTELKKEERPLNDAKVNADGDHDAQMKSMRSELRTSVLQTGLLAYLRSQGESGDPTYTYAQRFYLAQWFKDAQDEAKVATTAKNKSAKKVIRPTVLITILL